MSQTPRKLREFFRTLDPILQIHGHNVEQSRRDFVRTLSEIVSILHKLQLRLRLSRRLSNANSFILPGYGRIYVDQDLRNHES